MFFPSHAHAVGILLSFGTQAVGFAARPIGAIIFGHFGDRVGRKATLVATLMLMGLATALMSVVPSYSAIGVSAPAAYHAAHTPGDRCRRRMGRFGADVDGVGHTAPSRLLGQLAAGRVPIGLLLSTAMIKSSAHIAGSGFEHLGMAGALRF